MSSSISVDNRQSEQAYFLTQLLGTKVILRGKRIGRLEDRVILENGKIPLVTHLYISRWFGNPALLIPWEKVQSIGTNVIIVDIESLQKYEANPGQDTLLLKDYILDKKVLDLEGREVEVVYDVKLVMLNNKLYVSDVDVSRYGLLRRIGLRRLADLIYSLANQIKKETISWTYFQPLPTQIGSFKGNVKLNEAKTHNEESPS